MQSTLRNDLLPRKRTGKNPPRYSRLDGTARYPVALIGFLVTLVILLGGWGITMSALFAGRVDPPGHFQCGSVMVSEGDLCFDVIVAGGGNAGCAIAKRLSDDYRVNVLLLESGPDFVTHDETVSTVGYIYDYFRLPARFPNKYFQTVTTDIENGLITNTFDVNKFLTFAKMLGGGSSIDYMFYQRGTNNNWDLYDEEVGSPGFFTADRMNQIYQNMEWLQDYGRLATLTDRGFSGTVKLQGWPQNDTAGTEFELLANLQAAAFGVPPYLNESYNTPGFDFGAFAWNEFLWNFNQTLPQQQQR
jgi:hypothetical protein